MPSSKKSPILPRYLLARLRVLRRPSVWKAAVVPMLALIAASIYWVRPTWLGLGDRPLSQSTAKPSPVPSPTPSFDPADLDPANLDIDTLPNLGTLGLPTSRDNPSPTSLLTGSTPTEFLVPPAPSPSPSRVNGTALSPSRNPFSPNYSPNYAPGQAILPGQAVLPGQASAIAIPAGSALDGVLGGASSGASSGGDRPSAAASNSSSVREPNGASASQSVNAIHPLESALQRQATPPSPQGNVSAPLLPGVGSSTGGDRLPPAGTPRLSPTRPGQRSSGSYAPQTSPPLGNTGYTVPSNAQTAPVQSFPIGGGQTPTRLQPIPLQPGSYNSLGAGQNASGAARPQFGNGTFYTTPSVAGEGDAPEPEPPPFSSSNQSGRSGQINTFSNP